MKSIFPRLKSATLSDRIFRHVQEAIMTGTLAPSERIHADALARQFKVSHIPVREALTHLEAVGLIVQEPHAPLVGWGNAVPRASPPWA